MEAKEKGFDTGLEFKEVVCSKCHHSWKPRTRIIQSCPSCKNVRWWLPKRKPKKKEEKHEPIKP